MQLYRFKKTFEYHFRACCPILFFPVGLVTAGWATIIRKLGLE